MPYEGAVGGAVERMAGADVSWRGSGKSHAVVLGILAFAFLMRVLGQALVFFIGVDFLPSMAAWQSGLLPYPVLLASQILILGVQTKISRDLWRGSGFFAMRRPRAGRALRRFSYAYFAVMALRYVLTMAFYPERRWLGGTIPIVFHWVLAGYLFVLSQYHTARGGRHADSSHVP
jgi:hypothetical protein